MDESRPTSLPDTHYRLLEKLCPYFFYTREPRGDMVKVSSHVSRVLGWNDLEFHALWKKSFAGDPELPDKLAELWDLSGDFPESVKVEIEDARGNRVGLSIRETPVRDREGKIFKIQGAALLCPGKPQLENQVGFAESRFQEISRLSPVGIFQADPDDLYTYVNPAWEKITGRSQKDILGTLWWEVIHPQDRERVFSLWAEAEKLESEFNTECRILAPSGYEKWVQINSQFLFEEVGKVTCGNMQDITQRYEFQQDREKLISELFAMKRKLHKEARTDPLTGLANRRYMKEQLDQEQGRSQRSGIPFTLILLDIDHFKAINDTFGHDTGDFVLCEVARIQVENSRRQDCICRWGGEEFLILLPETNLDKGISTAERFRSQLESSILEHQGKSIHVTLSGGISVYDPQKENLDHCIKQADDFLYQAKENGRNRLVWPRNTVNTP